MGVRRLSAQPKGAQPLYLVNTQSGRQIPAYPDKLFEKNLWSGSLQGGFRFFLAQDAGARRHTQHERACAHIHAKTQKCFTECFTEIFWRGVGEAGAWGGPQGSLPQAGSAVADPLGRGGAKPATTSGFISGLQVLSEDRL